MAVCSLAHFKQDMSRLLVLKSDKITILKINGLCLILSATCISCTKKLPAYTAKFLELQYKAIG